MQVSSSMELPVEGRGREGGREGGARRAPHHRMVGNEYLINCRAAVAGAIGFRRWGRGGSRLRSPRGAAAGRRRSVRLHYAIRFVRAFGRALGNGCSWSRRRLGAGRKKGPRVEVLGGKRPLAARASMLRSPRRCGAIFPCAGAAREAARRVCLRAAPRSVFPGARPADYSAPCPASWSLDSDGGCLAPAGYAGPCVNRKRFVRSPARAVGAAARPSSPGAGRGRWRSSRGRVRPRIGARGFLALRQSKKLRGVRRMKHGCACGAGAPQRSNATRSGPSEFKRRARRAIFPRQRFKSPRCACSVAGNLVAAPRRAAFAPARPLHAGVHRRLIQGVRLCE